MPSQTETNRRIAEMMDRRDAWLEAMKVPTTDSWHGVIKPRLDHESKDDRRWNVLVRGMARGTFSFSADLTRTDDTTWADIIDGFYTDENGLLVPMLAPNNGRVFY